MQPEPRERTWCRVAGMPSRGLIRKICLSVKDRRIWRSVLEWGTTPCLPFQAQRLDCATDHHVGRDAPPLTPLLATNPPLAGLSVSVTKREWSLEKSRETLLRSALELSPKTEGAAFAPGTRTVMLP
jgi:hypothetical protein